MSSLAESIRQFVDRAPGLKILIVGDAMLDTYIAGDATRISPEAPVPVVAVSGTRWVPGGAANVAANVRSLGAAAILGGVTGQDTAAATLCAELDRASIDRSCLVEDSGRITTSKTRVLAAGQQIVRFDEEDTAPLAPQILAQLEEACANALAKIDAVVLSDYAKGVISPDFCCWVLDAAARLGKPVVVDPKSPDLARYRGATVITPNLKETSAASGDPIHNSAQLAEAAAHLMARIAPSALLVTRGGEGMSLFHSDDNSLFLPAIPVEVADVTGAGDTVVATLGIALGMGMPLEEAAALANIAAGLAVRHLGNWAVRSAELLSHTEH